MKISKMRLIKSLSLVGMLALCLLLTGCVVPPEDIGANGNYVVTDGDLPFQSLGPAITNTPYVPPVNTPTSAPTRNPVVTKAPTPTPNLGSIGVGNTTIPGQSLPNVTAPQIQVIINTSTATPSAGTSTTLKNGSTGAEVKKLQQRLKDLGYLKGSVDGDFGDATESAVKAFQAQHGLSVDGKAGANTLSKLYSSTAKKAPTTTATNTPRPTNTPFTSYKKGDTGSEISKIQQRLKALGYLKGSVDGDFGEATEDAVRAFQKQNGLTVDGKVGSYTLDKLYSSTAKKAAATNTPRPTATPFTSYKNGDTGSEIRRIQNRLKALGYLKGSVDGTFGDTTEDAVRAFQKQNRLTVDGKVGAYTLDKLFSASAATAKPTVTATPKPTATPKAENLDYYLEIGSSGTKVRTLQNRLIELGWLEGQADGKYGNATEYAVKAFQGRYASLWKDGVAGPDTLKILYGAGAATSKTPAASLGVTLEPGDDNDAVAAMQKRLKELGFYKSTADGEFGNVTKAALIAFQTANGLKADGVANTATLNKLYSASAKDADAFKDEEDARNEEDEDVKDDDEDIKDDPSDVDNIQVNGYTTLRWGDTGAAVKKLQEALKNRGYYDGKIDSTFGSGVYAAIKAFQKQNGLKVDGVAGPATQTLLYGSSASSSSTNVTLKLGSTGTKVRNLQYVLYELGYYDGAIDGDFDDITASSVRHFQMVNGISPVDGVAGYKTLNILYSKNALSASTSVSAGSTTYTALSQGDKGTLVVEMQEMLQELGYLSEVTGTYDDATVEAVKNFQRRNDLTADGKAGPETQKVLYGPGPKPAW